MQQSCYSVKVTVVLLESITAVNVREAEIHPRSHTSFTGRLQRASRLRQQELLWEMLTICRRFSDQHTVVPCSVWAGNRAILTKAETSVATPM